MASRSPKQKETAKDAMCRLRWRYKYHILSRYSGGKPECSCCGEYRLPFLTLDHKYGDGKQHRVMTGFGMKFYRWIVKNNYPDGLRVLCWNCNSGSQINGGVCPHIRINIPEFSIQVTPNPKSPTNRFGGMDFGGPNDADE